MPTHFKVGYFMENDNIPQYLYDGVVAIFNKMMKNNNSAVITDVLVQQQNEDGTYQIKYAGRSYNVPLYGNNTITVNMTAKLFIPNNNMSLAFIM